MFVSLQYDPLQISILEIEPCVHDGINAAEVECRILQVSLILSSMTFAVHYAEASPPDWICLNVWHMVIYIFPFI